MATTDGNNFLSIIPKFLANPFGFVKNGKSEKKVEGGGENKKADVVRFPVSKPEVEPLKVENEDAPNSNPFFLWQGSLGATVKMLFCDHEVTGSSPGSSLLQKCKVYALGGIIVLRWAWGKWQEKQANAKKDSSGEDQPPAAAAATATEEEAPPAAAEAPASVPEVDTTPAEE